MGIIGHRSRHQVALHHLVLVKLCQHPRKVVAVLVEKSLLGRGFGLGGVFDGICLGRFILSGFLLVLGAVLLLLSILLRLGIFLVIQFATENLGQHFVLDAATPDVVAFLRRLRPGGVLAVVHVRFVHREIDFPFFQVVRHKADALCQTQHKGLVDVVDEGDVTLAERRADSCLHAAKAIKVALQEHGVVVVVHCHEVCPGSLGDLFVKRTLGDVVRRQHVRDLAGDTGVVLLRFEGEGALDRGGIFSYDREDAGRQENGNVIFHVHMVVSINWASRAISLAEHRP